MIKTIVLILAAGMAPPPLAWAQQNDRLAVTVEALKFIKKDLGPNTVIDSDLLRHYVDYEGRASSRLQDIAEQVQVKLLSASGQPRCSSEGNAYYIAPERFVRFETPLFQGTARQ